MVPAVVEANVPMLTGAAKEPDAFDSWAVNIFPALAVPLVVYETFKPAPAQ